MIRNEKQYQVTKNRLIDFTEALARLDSSGIEGLEKEIHTSALKSQIEEFQEEIMEYERLRDGKKRSISINSLNQFHEVLIKARICKGWTQADLAKHLEMKEQQIQRYEFCNYSTASISRINEVASMLGVEYSPIRVQLVQRSLPALEGINDNELEQGFNKLLEARHERGYIVVPENK